MKLFQLAFALLFTVAVTAQTTDAYKADTIDFIKLTGVAASFDNAIDQIGAMVPEAKKADFKAEANGTLANLYSKLADIYMKEFTSEEITELKAFYESDLGKKLASKQTSLTQQGMALGQNWGMEVGAIAQKYQN